MLLVNSGEWVSREMTEVRRARWRKLQVGCCASRVVNFGTRHISLTFNAGIKSLRATLPAEIFYWGF
jgi:hypothetical protein